MQFVGTQHLVHIHMGLVQASRMRIRSTKPIRPTRLAMQFVGTQYLTHTHVSRTYRHILAVIVCVHVCAYMYAHTCVYQSAYVCVSKINGEEMRERSDR